MRILIVGAGVIGTVYGAHLAAAGHAVSVLSHPPRTTRLATGGLLAVDALSGSRTHRCWRAIHVRTGPMSATHGTFGPCPASWPVLDWAHSGKEVRP